MHPGRVNSSEKSGLASDGWQRGPCRYLRLAAVALVPLLAAACCGLSAPPAEGFFDRRSPDGTLKGFVYAIDAHQWDYAYASLTDASRDEVGRLRFEIVIRFLKDPRTEVPLYDLISSASERRSKARFSRTGDAAMVKVVSKVRDPQGTIVYVPADVLFRHEEGEWRLDLLRSLGVDS